MNARSLIPARLLPLASRVAHRLHPAKELRRWERAAFTMPAPPFVKRSVLLRYGRPTDTWIETGTFLGDTTEFLATSARHVYSIEPEPSLAERARQRFRARSTVTIIEGLSEECIGDLLDRVEGPLSLWLDGHYSAGITHQGPTDTPIRQELEALRQRVHRFDTLTVCVDDVRCFDPANPEYAHYPTRSWLVQWADDCGLRWTIEHDIFVAVRNSADAIR